MVAGGDFDKDIQVNRGLRRDASNRCDIALNQDVIRLRQGLQVGFRTNNDRLNTLAPCAHQTLRMEPVSMALGEACGIAARKAQTSDTSIRAVDVKFVPREIVKRGGVILCENIAIVPAGLKPYPNSSTTMNNPSEKHLTRRDALLGTLKCTFAASLSLPAVVQATPLSVPAPEPEFVPENDYPFFGGAVPEAYLANA